jgi:hypothetical protein
MILPKSSANNNNKVVTITPKLRRQLTIDRHFFKNNKIKNPFVKTRHLQQDIPILLSFVTTLQKLTNTHWSWAIIVHHFQCKNSQKHTHPELSLFTIFRFKITDSYPKDLFMCFFRSPLSLFTNSIEVHVYAEQNDTNCNFGPNISCCDSQINPNFSQLSVSDNAQQKKHRHYCRHFIQLPPLTQPTDEGYWLAKTQKLMHPEHWWPALILVCIWTEQCVQFSLPVLAKKQWWWRPKTYWLT